MTMYIGHWSCASYLAVAQRVKGRIVTSDKTKNNNYNRLLFILNLTRDKLKITDNHSVLELLYMNVF